MYMLNANRAKLKSVNFWLAALFINTSAAKINSNRKTNILPMRYGMDIIKND
jgi:hypothetical protein